MVGKGIHYRGGFQEFRDWSNKFSQALLSAEYETQRQSFLKFRVCRRLRAGVVLISLYIFAQQLEAEIYSDAHFDEESNAAKELGQLIEGFAHDTTPYLAILKNAPGMWSSEAEAVNRTVLQMKEIVRVPGTKRGRNSLHRTMQQTLLRLVVYMCGHVDTSRPKQTDIRSRLIRCITSVALGPNPGLDGEQGRSLAQIAALPAWISTDTLKKLYYEDRSRASEDIYQHYFDHR
jgi:hypothetical protein